MSEAKKVLIVEDDTFLSDVYEHQLKTAGIEVLVTHNGQEALDALDGFTPNLIMTDLIMPVMDGTTFIANVKKHESHKDIPVVVLSNLGQEKDVEECKELGAIDHLVKTDVDIGQIVEVVERYLTPPQGQDQPQG